VNLDGKSKYVFDIFVKVVVVVVVVVVVLGCRSALILAFCCRLVSDCEPRA